MASRGTRAVQLSIPADPRMLRFARVTAAAMAVDLSFSIEEIEDLRVAVDELAAAAIEGCDESTVLQLSFEVRDSELCVDGTVPAEGPLPELHPMARELLELLADDYKFVAHDGTREFSLSKTRSTEE
jgi:hypothetical protein